MTPYSNGMRMSTKDQALSTKDGEEFQNEPLADFSKLEPNRDGDG